MLTVKQLVANTNSHRSNVVKNSSDVTIAFGKTREGKDPRGYYKAVVGRALSRGRNKRQKKFEIRLYYPMTRAKADQYIPPALRKGLYTGPEKAPPFTIQSKVWVSCDCEYFLYHCEVADAEHDSASIKYSNGKYPTQTNPQGVGHICKHLLASVRKGALLKK